MSRYEIFIHYDTQSDKLCKSKSLKVNFALHALQLSVKLRKSKRTTSGATSLSFTLQKDISLVIYFQSGFQHRFTCAKIFLLPNF